MIYIKNSTEIQKIYIPKNDGMPCSSSHKGSGYDEGYHDGYVDGVGDGEQAIIATFTSATITENGEYGSSASPYSSVTVSIDTASTYNEGYESGVTDGEQNIINTFTSDTLTVNGIYGSSAHPYSSVTVDVDLDAPYESGYTDGYESGYSSGWSSGYSSGFSSGETTGYDEGYDSGYTSGMSSGYSKGWSEGFPEGQQDIINTFTSETLTVNGIYGSSAHPYSSVTVDVDMDAPYESGYTDGYESGYTSGYSSGYTSGETAGYDSGYSEGYESGYSSGSDVGYASGYSSGYTSGYTSGETAGYDSGFTSGYSEGYDSGFTSGETVGYESGVTDGYSSGYTSGETDGFNSGYTSGVTDGEQNIIDTFTAMTANTNGVYGSSAQPLSSITVDVPTGETSVLTAGTFTENGTYEPSVVTFLDYIETDGYDILFDTGVKMTSTGQTVILDFMPLTGTIHYDAYLCYMAQQENDNSDTWQLGFRQATIFANNPNGGYWYTNGNMVNRYVRDLISADTRAYVEISNTGITINGISSAFNITTVVNTDCNIVLNGQYASNANYRCPYARYYGFKLIDDDGVTDLADLRPALDGNIPCFYDMVSGNFIHQFGTGHTTAGNVIGTSAVTNFDGWSSVTVNVDTASTYNQGYQSGVTDGEQNIIGTFRAYTATTNGVYGSSAHPLSSITVDVPQSGGSGSCTGSSEPVLTAWGVEYDTGIALDWGYSLSASHVTLRPDLSSNNYEYIIGCHSDVFGYYGLYRHYNDVIFKSTHNKSVKGLTYDSSFYTSTAGTEINGETIDSSDEIVPTDTIKFFSDSSGNCITTSGQTLGVVEIWDENQNLVGRFTPQPDGTFYDDVNDTTIYPTVLDQNNYGYSFEYYDSQYREGCKDGWDIGFDDGWGRGYDWGYSSGYSNGHTDGYEEGISDGFYEGYQSGYTDGSQGGGGSQDLIDYIEGDLINFDIPSGTTKIRSYAFDRMTSLSSVTISDSVTEIWEYAFRECTGLTNIVIPDSVTVIASYVFSGCTSLTDISIPDSVTGLGSYAFIMCTNLTAATIGSGLTAIPNSAFNFDIKLKQITFRNPNPPTSLGRKAFPTGTAYASGGTMYVPSGSSATYSTWKNTNATAKLSFSGWTVTEYTLDE